MNINFDNYLLKMAWLFKKKEISEEEERYIFTQEILGEKKFTLGFKDTYLVSAYDLLRCNLKPYWGQRAKDEIHINTIAQGIQTSQGLFHPIILAQVVPRKEFSILDGQHRYAALSRISETQRKTIIIQVDVLRFEEEDDQWILHNYYNINIVKGISREDLNKENKVNRIVENISKHFGNLRGGHAKIGEYSQKNKQNSRLLKSKFKEELLNRFQTLPQDENEIMKMVIEYNDKCIKGWEKNFKGLRIGSNTLDECVNRQFWLGINFPGWLDEVFN